MRSPTVALAAAVLALAAAAAPAADAVTVRVVAGQAYEGFVLASGETHAFVMEDFLPLPFSVTLKRTGAGSTLQPDLTLEDPTGADVTAALVPYRKDTATSVKVKKAPPPSGPGRYVLRVTGKAGTIGTYSLKVTSAITKTFKGTGFVPGSNDSDIVPFPAPTESTCTLKIAAVAPGALAPQFESVTGPGCLDAAVVPVAGKTGQGTLQVPLGGHYFVKIGGAGGTVGAFKFTVKIKIPKPLKTPVRVNAGAATFPGPGPSPAVSVVSAGQAAAGFAVDSLGIAWREYRTQGNPQQNGRNSAELFTFKGSQKTNLANNFATDGTPEARAVALGPVAVVMEAGGALYAFPRAGGPEEVLDAAAGDVVRTLCDASTAYYLRADGLFSIPLAGGSPTALPAAAGTLLDMTFGGRGIVYAVDTGGTLEIRAMTRAGADDALLAALSPAPGVRALAARGADAFLAADDGAGGTNLLRIPACGGPPVPLFTGGPVTALAVDEWCVYGVEDDVDGGKWVRQFPRGGGVSTVLVRASGDGSFTVDPSGIGAAGGCAYFLSGGGGGPEFWKVKRK